MSPTHSGDTSRCHDAALRVAQKQTARKHTPTNPVRLTWKTRSCFKLPFSSCNLSDHRGEGDAAAATKLQRNSFSAQTFQSPRRTVSFRLCPVKRKKKVCGIALWQLAVSGICLRLMMNCGQTILVGQGQNEVWGRGGGSNWLLQARQSPDLYKREGWVEAVRVEGAWFIEISLRGWSTL